jgi:hypothetical protein
MNRYLNLTTLVAAAWWSTVLFTWATITDVHSDAASFELAGSELSQTLVLTPAIVLLITLIARYRKIPNLIMLFASLFALWSAYLAFTLNPAATPAAIDGLEKLTGIAGTVGAYSTTLAPSAYLAMSLGTVVLSVLAAFHKPTERLAKVESEPEEPSDPKSLWDSQS